MTSRCDMTAELRSFGFWIDFLRRTWSGSRIELLHFILNARRVRENWIQGDVYLAAHTSKDPPLPWFSCNYKPLEYAGPADWSYWTSNERESDGAEALMLAEVK